MGSWLTNTFGSTSYGLSQAKNYVAISEIVDSIELPEVQPYEDNLINTGMGAGTITYAGLTTNMLGTVMTTVDGKNSIYYQPLAPATAAVNDIWFDTDNNFLMYRYTGSYWVNSTLNGNNITAGTIDANQVNVANINAGNITTGLLDAARIRLVVTSEAANKAGIFVNVPALSVGVSVIAGSHGGWFTGGNVGVVADGDSIGLEARSDYRAIKATTYASSGEWGLTTDNKVYAAGGFSPFTGSHICYSTDTHEVGDIVVSKDAWAITINQTLVHVTKSSLKNSNVFGVVNYVKDTLMDNIEKNTLISWEETKIENDRVIGTGVWHIKDEYKPYIEYMQINDFKELSVNALGEGGINVCEANGDILNGDYITSSDIPGKGMKQDDDILHNYTVAKALEDVIWADQVVGEAGVFMFNNVKCKMIACTYHCG